MRIKNNPSTGTLLLAGLATGAAAWYLLKTENGRRTITQLSGTLKGVSDNAVHKAGEAFSHLKSKVNKFNA